MLYTGYGAHKFTNFDLFLVLQAEIWYGGVSVCKDISEKFYIGVQYHSYQMLVEFYLQAACKWSKSSSWTFGEVLKNNFLEDFGENCGAT